MIITKYWLYPLCSTMYSWPYLTASCLYLPFLTPVLPFSILPTGTHPFVLYMCNNFFFDIFTSLLYF